MTTRRRRADSDSHHSDASPEDLLQRSAAVGAVPLIDVQASLQLAAGGGGALAWTPTATPHDAYYKKTDTPLLSNPAYANASHSNGYNSNSGYNNTNIYTNQHSFASQGLGFNQAYGGNTGYSVQSNNQSYPNTQTNSFANTPVSAYNNTPTNNNPWSNFSQGLSSYLSINTDITNSQQHNQQQQHGYQHHSQQPQQQHQELLDYPEITVPRWDTCDMSCRDRTAEFAGIIRSQQNGPQAPRLPPVRPPRGDLAHYSAFMARARLVGRNIAATFAKLERLTQLAKKRSLFDDTSDAEVQELTAIIRHDLTTLTKQLADLRPAPSDAGQLQRHSSNLLGHLQGRVATVTKAFRGVLEVRTENLKRQAERREQFTGGLGGGSTGQTSSVLMADEAKASHHRRGDSADMVLDLDDIMSQDMMQSTMAAESDSLLRARADDMKTIESTIVELGGMFSQLATMVKEQDELVYRIDANVDDAEMNVEAAHSELLKYFKGVSSNRWLMVKVFGIVMVFMLFFIVFMA